MFKPKLSKFHPVFNLTYYIYSFLFIFNITLSSVCADHMLTRECGITHWSGMYLLGATHLQKTDSALPRDHLPSISQ